MIVYASLAHPSLGWMVRYLGIDPSSAVRKTADLASGRIPHCSHTISLLGMLAMEPDLRVELRPAGYRSAALPLS